MKICGIEIKGSEAILAIAQLVDGKIAHVPVETKKIALQDDEKSEYVKSFGELFRGFARDNGLHAIVIKKRNKKGEYAGGPMTFKIEGLIQAIDNCDVELISPQTVSASNRKNQFQVPASLKKYQQEAYLTACAGLFKAEE